MSGEKPENGGSGLRSELARLAWAAAFFALALGVLVVVFAIGLFH